MEILKILLGIGLIVFGILLTLKEQKIWSKWRNNNWAGDIRGVGGACIGIGVIIILETFFER